MSIKRISCFIICSLVFISTKAQTIVINKGMKLETVTAIKTTINIEALGQNVETETALTNLVETKNVTDTGYLFSTTTRRMTLKTNSMGQKIDFDSDKPEDLNGPFGSKVKGVIGSVSDIVVSKKGVITLLSSTLTPGADNPLSQAADFTGFLAKGQPYPLLMPLPGRPVKKGDTWVDSTGNKDSAFYIYNYTLKENTDKESIVEIMGINRINMVINQGGMEIQIKLDGKVSGNSVFEKATGILRTSSSVSQNTGTMSVMGQTVPISTVSTISIDVTK